MEATTRSRGRSSLTSGGVTNTGKIPMLLGNEGDEKAARGPSEPGLVLDEVERFLGSPVDGSIWREESTRPPEHETDEVEKRGSLRE